jgi:diacylglycerol kinase family enzyme
LGLPRRFEDALGVIEAGVLRTIDAGWVEFHDGSGRPCQRGFVNEASAGLSGATVRGVGRFSKRIGPRSGYAAGAVAAILAHRPAAVAVEIDGDRVYEGDVSLVVGANGRSFGAGMPIAPRAEIDDGRLEVVLVRGLSTPRLLLHLPSLFRGRHLDHAAVSRYSARELRVVSLRTSAAMDVEVDGEAAGQLPLRVEIRPAALRVLVPDGGREASAASAGGALAAGRIEQ